VDRAQITLTTTNSPQPPWSLTRNSERHLSASSHVLPDDMLISLYPPFLPLLYAFNESSQVRCNLHSLIISKVRFNALPNHISHTILLKRETRTSLLVSFLFPCQNNAASRCACRRHTCCGRYYKLNGLALFHSLHGFEHAHSVSGLRAVIISAPCLFNATDSSLETGLYAWHPWEYHSYWTARTQASTLTSQFSKFTVHT
jgi:hypothetical protein